MLGLNEDLLVEMVDEFLEPFGCDSDFDSDFFYDAEEERVYFSILSAERSERLFKEYILKTFNVNIENIFMISLLHEVGHHFTIYNFSAPELKKAHKEKEKIEKELNKADNDLTFSRYFDINIEKVATEWAINYYLSHQARCEKFFKAFSEKLHEEYKRFGVIA